MNYVAPFADYASFYQEYQHYTVANNDPPEKLAGETTFREAYKSLRADGIRKLKARGHMNTCEICNNANDLLKNKSELLCMRDLCCDVCSICCVAV
jgi:hypothetical protein